MTQAEASKRYAGRVASFVEQGCLSGFNFLNLVFWARYLAPEDYGSLALAYGVLWFVQSMHRSTVSLPLVVYNPNRAALYSEAQNWHSLQLAAGGAVLAVMLVALLLTWAIAGINWFAQSLAMAIAFVLPVLYYDFFRRWLIIERGIGAVVPVAVVYAAVLTAGMAFGLLVAAELWVAALSFSLANAVAAGFGFLRASGPGLRARPFGEFVAGLRAFGFWALLGNLAYNGYNHAHQILLGALAGPAAVAAFQATRNLVQPIFTLLTTVDNLDKPRLSGALHDGGESGLVRQLKSTSRFLVPVALVYLALMSGFATDILGLLYGDKYVDAGGLAYWWAVVAALMVATYPFETGLFVMKLPERLILGRCLAAAVSIGLALLLVPRLGAHGAMIAAAAGWAIALGASVLRLPRALRCRAGQGAA